MRNMIKVINIVLLSCMLMSCAVAQDKRKASQIKDPIAENMLVYQRSIGGWPKAVDKVPVDYKKTLTDEQRKNIRLDSLHNDATIDNKATTREIEYLISAYAKTDNEKYLSAAKKGVEFLLMAQYENGGWPQYYPDHSNYRGQITYNDNAMINVLNILQDIVEAKNGFEAMNSYKEKAGQAVKKGVSCILKTQIRVDGELTVWCAQYDQHTLAPAKARAFELVSLSGGESVDIVLFLMRMHPNAEIINSINSAVKWFDKTRITGYDFVLINDPKQPKGKDRVLIKKEGSVIWARFYDIQTNKPTFTGRDSQPKSTVGEIDVERRVGYSWYGTWPQKLFDKKYPEWLKKIK